MNTPARPPAPKLSHLRGGADAAHVVISGTGRVGDAITLLDDGVPAGRAVVDAHGLWEVTLPAPAMWSSKIFAATATDRAGNVSKPSNEAWVATREWDGGRNYDVILPGIGETYVAPFGDILLLLPVTDRVGGNFSVETGDGDDDIYSPSSSDDTISAGGGNNSIHLNGGHYLITSSGNDHIFTGFRSATVVAADSATDRITPGSGTLLFVAGAGAATVEAGRGSVTVFGAGGDGVFHGGAAGQNALYAGDGAATLFGGGNGDVLVAGGAHGQVLVAGAGSETLNGGLSSGDDAFYAGSGRTLITGGFGHDLFVAGTGAATMYSGQGADVFRFVRGQAGGSAVIKHMDGGDRLQLLGYGSRAVEDVLHSQVNGGGDTAITLSDNTRVFFMGVARLTAGQFIP